MKKLIILISVIIIFFVFFLFMYFIPRNYEKTYELNKVKVTEKYNKEKAFYAFSFEYKNKKFELVSTNKYITKRGLIKKIKIIKDDEFICIDPKSNYITTYPLCYQGDKYIDYNLLDLAEYSSEIKKVNDNYKDININYLNDKTFLLWNYKGFTYINSDKTKEIKFLKKDTYNIELAAQVNNYLIIPNYDNKHSFDKIFVINMKKGNIKTWELDDEIYFDSYILGADKKSVYLFDNKNEIEYELRPDKMKIRKVKYKAIINDNWEKVTLSELNKKITFSKKNVYNYEITNNELYLSYLEGNLKRLISNNKIKEIVLVDNDTVYYLSEDKLYMYNELIGEVLLMSYFEWNFNYQNMIYIY